MMMTYRTTAPLTTPFSQTLVYEHVSTHPSLGANPNPNPPLELTAKP